MAVQRWGVMQVAQPVWAQVQHMGAELLGVMVHTLPAVPWETAEAARVRGCNAWLDLFTADAPLAAAPMPTAMLRRCRTPIYTLGKGLSEGVLAVAWGHAEPLVLDASAAGAGTQAMVQALAAVLAPAAQARSWFLGEHRLFFSCHAEALSVRSDVALRVPDIAAAVVLQQSLLSGQNCCTPQVEDEILDARCCDARAVDTALGCAALHVMHLPNALGEPQVGVRLCVHVTCPRGTTVQVLCVTHGPRAHRARIEQALYWVVAGLSMAP